MASVVVVRASVGRINTSTRRFCERPLSLVLAAMCVGCGGEEGGVATGPAEPAPELTPEEEATEEAYVQEVEQQ